MQIIGRITKADLSIMKARGMTPKQAVDAILQEARHRHPRQDTIIINGMDIVAL